MRVLVTGASGLIGSSVCDALLARGDEVVGLSRDPVRAARSNPTVSWHAWNPALERPPEESLQGIDAVVNLIGESLNQRLTPEAKQRIRDSRERATKNLVDAITAPRNGPRVLVSQSAVGYYGERGEALVDESTEPGSDFLAQVCVAWEAAAREAERGGVRTVVTRTAPVLDPREGLLKELLLPFRLGLGGPLAGGRQYMPWIHRDDTVGIIVRALDDDAFSGAVNATAPEPPTNAEFSKALGRALRRPAVLPVPGLALEALYGDMAQLVTASRRVVPKRLGELGYEYRHPNLDEALRTALA
jgi:uncharacterized protein (TIGR01777 family)